MPSPVYNQEMSEKYQFTSEASVVNLERGINPTDIPNGLVMRGPAGEPLLVDYDDNGQMCNSGTEVEIGKWLPTIGKVIPVDMVILVHSVKGEGQMLLKSLEVNRIMRDGKKLTVQEAAREGVLPQFAETIRQKYMESLEEKGAACKRKRTCP
jgi:hypothetical protein